jgi:hypothetical protein
LTTLGENAKLGGNNGKQAQRNGQFELLDDDSSDSDDSLINTVNDERLKLIRVEKASSTSSTGTAKQSAEVLNNPAAMEESTSTAM